jgi:homospermidine synthase
MGDNNINGGREKCRETCHQVEVPSKKEVMALNEMRAIKGRVRDIKRRLSDLDNHERDENAGEVGVLQTELKRLKVEWVEWEKRRQEAAKERMILLGHEEP